MVEVMPQSPRMHSKREQPYNLSKDLAAVALQKRLAENPYYQQIERATIEQGRDRTTVRAKARLSHLGKTSDKAAKRTMEALSKQELLRSNFAGSVERGQAAAKSVSSGPALEEGHGVTMPKLSLPDVHQRPQQSTGVASLANSNGTNGCGPLA